MTFLRRIAALVAYHYEIEPDEIFGRSRNAEISEARHMTIWLARRHKSPVTSANRIAKALGRDLATIINSSEVSEMKIKAGGPFATLALRLDEYFHKVGIEKAARIAAAINAEAESVEPTKHYLAEQNQRFTQAMRRETEAA